MTDKEGMILVTDTETTMNNKVGKNKASAFCPDNYVVMYGAKSQIHDEPIVSYKYSKKEYLNIAKNLDTAEVKILVGQNIKFDLHHLRNQNCTIHKIPLIEWLPNNKIWDTQLAEYILTGQQHKYASLDELCNKYNLPVKASEVTDIFKQGKGADHIDPIILRSYLKTDISNTEAVAHKQMETAYKNNKLPLIESMMDALMAITDMEYNGLAIDHNLLQTQRNDLYMQTSNLHYDILNAIKSIYPQITQFNIDSNKQLSTLLFGGTIEEETKVPYTTKKGTTRNKVLKNTINITGFFSPLSVSTPTANGWKVDEEVLTNLLPVSDSRWMPIIEKILKRKKLLKELNTYYEGLSELVFPDGLIHHNINMCATDTGRTSASEPNSQNIPSHEESDVKKLFVSRWGNNGSIISVDYKQIEVIALAYLSQDPQLVSDLLKGRDIHEEVGKLYYGNGHTMSKDERRIIKTVNFGLIYGGSAKVLAPQAGITVKEAKRIIDYFYIRYPRVKWWQDENISKVIGSRIFTGANSPKGIPSGEGKLLSPTGRDYIFHEKDHPFKPLRVNFKPTEIKNYPVQGFATGDLVLTMTGILWRKLRTSLLLKDHCLITNLVHDELVFDCQNDYVAGACNFIKNILEDTPKYMKNIYNIDLGLPTKVEVSVGPNWKEVKKIDL